jgi:hypothetical protein
LRKKQTLFTENNRIQHGAVSRPRLIALLLALATLVIYLPVTHYDFINYDDPDYVTKNPMVEQGPGFRTWWIANYSA